jgi:uncharacterized protein YbjT (DUF2867 family)
VFGDLEIGRSEMVIAVAGATGNVGGALVRMLAEQGHEVRAILRQDGAARGLPADVAIVTGDLNQAAGLGDAFEGAEGAFLLSGYDDAGLVSALERAGVRRVALLSSSAAPTGDVTNAVAAYHIRSEQALRDSTLGWTFLRPNAFMTNTLQWVDSIRAGEPVVAPFANVPISTNDPRDVAAVAAVSLTSGAYDGVAHRITGPEPLLPSERLTILSEVLGRELTFRAQSDAEARADMIARMPAEYVDAFFDFYVAGAVDETSVRPTIEEVTGRPPRTFRAWAEENAEAFL